MKLYYFGADRAFSKLCKQFYNTLRQNIILMEKTTIYLAKKECKWKPLWEGCILFGPPYRAHL